MCTTLFKNARLILPTGIFLGELLVRDDKIEAVSINHALPHFEAQHTVDVNGKYLSPGFIETHTHGAGGFDFMDGDLDSIYGACRSHLCHGTTSIVPTTITSTKASLLEFIQLFNQVELTHPDMPNILGLHLEGPYFAYEQRGAQDPQYLRDPDEREYKEVLSKTNRIRRWSFAVELDGAERFLRTLQDHGIVSSLAHSNATTEQVFRAYENGMRALTHFYSGMSGVRRIDAFRVGGAIEAGYLLDDLFVEVIADGCHLPKELLQLIYKVKGADRICLVTDSMRGAGMPDGHYVLGNKNTGLDTIVEDGVAKLPDRCSFAGSVATSNRLVRTFRNLTSAPLYEVVRMASLTPAKLLGISHQTGSIANGKKADLIIFDEHISVSFVMVNGRPLIA